MEVDHESENKAKEEREYIGMIEEEREYTEMIPNVNISSLKGVEMQDDYFAQTKYSKLAIAGIYKDTSQMSIEELKEAHSHTQKWKEAMLIENERVDYRLSDITRRAAELSLLEIVNGVTNTYGLNFKSTTIKKQKTRQTGTLEL